MKVREAIRAARGEQTRREFGDKVGVSDVTVWKWENGQSVPTDIETVARLIEAGVPSDVFGPQVARLAAAVDGPWRRGSVQAAFA